VKKQKADPSVVNLLELIPDKNIKSEKSEDGFSVLLKPKYRHPLFVKHVLPHMKRPNYKINLDDIGTFIWDLCDGKNTVEEIGNKLKETFGDKVEPLYDRLRIFFQNLEKNKFITFKNL